MGFKKGEVEGIQIVGIIALFAVVLYGAWQLNILKVGAGVLTGGSVLSIQQVAITSPDSYFHDKSWVANIVINGNGETVFGSQNQFKETIPTGYVADGDLNINFDLGYEHCLYTPTRAVSNNQVPLYRAEGLTFTYTQNWISTQTNGGVCSLPGLNNQGSYETECRNNGGVPLQCSYVIGGIGRQCFKVVADNFGDVYTISKPSPDWSTNFVITNGTGGREAFVLGNDILTNAGANAAVQFTQFGSSGGACPAGTDQSMIKKADGTWRVVPSSSIALQSLRQKTASEWQSEVPLPSDKAALDRAVSNANQNSYNIWTTGVLPDWQPASYLPSVNQILLDYSSHPIFYPNFKMYVRANWLGIRIPQTIPQLISVSTPTTQGGQSGAFIATIKNTGTAGGIRVYAKDCQSPLVATTVTNPTSFEAGQTLQVSVPFTTSSVSGVQDRTCTIRAENAINNNLLSEITGIVHLTPSCTLTAYGSWTVRNNPDGTCERVCNLQQAACPANYIVDSSSCTCIPSTPPSSCGNHVCDASESYQNCPQDCTQPVTTCADGTARGACTKSPPTYCKMDGNLITNSQVCGCPVGQTANPDGTCSAGGTGISIEQIIGMLVVLGALVTVGAVVYVIKGRE